MSGLRVAKTSLLCSLQDLGRVGFGDIGITQSGVMDEVSYNYLNLLLNNPFGTNALEINLGQMEFEVLGETNIAFTGASAKISINSKQIPMYKSLHVEQNDKIKIEFATNGTILYLGVEGGFDIPKVLNSNSVSIKEKIGGEAVKVGDILPFTCRASKESRRLKDNYLPSYKEQITLHVIPAYQYEDFDKTQIEKFFSSTYQTTPQSNRMGFRLSGNALKNVQKGIISEAISYGAVQIPAHGEPIVLLNERQSIGGYPKIGTVLPLDCFILAQSKIGTKVKFKKISLENAVKKMREFYKIF